MAAASRVSTVDAGNERAATVRELVRSEGQVYSG